MMKRLIKNLLTTTLTVLLAVGVFGIATPKKVHAAGNLTVVISYNGDSVTFENKGIGDTFYRSNFKIGGLTEVSMLGTCSGSMESVSMTSVKIKSTGSGTVRAYTDAGEVTFSVDVHEHSWTDASYSASGNVITATCQGSGTCPETTKPTLTLSATSKTYDGSVVTATLTPNDTWTKFNLGTPAITYSPTNSKNAGTYTASVTKGNATASKQFTISKKTLTLSGVTAKNKVYDGNVTADLDTTSAALSGVSSGDNVEIDQITGVFTAGKNIGNGKAIEVTTTLKGTDIGNYEVTPLNLTANITKRPITVISGIKVNDRAYDGTVNAKIDYTDLVLEGKVEGDALGVRVAGSFTSKNVGTEILVNISGHSLNGNDKGNYVIAEGADIQTEAYADIYQKEVGLTWGENTFTYDGQPHFPTATATGLAYYDTCNVTVEGEQTNAGTYTATAVSLDNDNYKLPSSNTKEYTINKRPIDVVGLKANGKVYDGNVTASFDTSSVSFSDLVEGDDVQLDEITGEFANKNVGENKDVTVTSSSLKGTASDNYTLNPIAGLKATIHHLATEVKGITASDKVYDGTTDATVDTSNAQFVNAVDGDELTITATGEFDEPNVGDRTVNLTLGDLGGADAGNYIFDKNDSQKTASAKITPKAMTVSATGYEDDYDGEAHSITVTVTDPANGYTITYKGPNDSEYGDNPEFTDPGEYEVSYKVTAPNYEDYEGTETVNIIGLDFEGISSDPYSGVYDGNYHTIRLTLPLDCEDCTVWYSESEDGTYQQEPILYKDFTDGAKTVYYKVTQTGYNDFKSSDTVNITQKEVALDWTNTDLTYNGQAQKPTATATGLVEGDSCTVTVTGEQTDSNAKTETENYTATATELSNTNYKLPENVTAEFTIAQKEVDIEWTDTELTYNGQAQKPTATATDLETGDSCTVTVTGEKTDSNAKSGEPTYTATATKLSNKNYKLSQSADTTEDFTIGQREITVNGITSTGKIYDGNTDATESLYYEDEHLVGKVEGDNLELNVTGTFENAEVGTDKIITLSNLELTGDDKDNYVLAATGQQETTTGNISQQILTITAKNTEKFYGEEDPEEFEYEAQGIVVGDTIEGALSRQQGEDVGDYFITRGTLQASGNYAIDYTHGILTIKKATENNVTANITGWTYGDLANSPGATGKFGADTATFTYSDSADGEYSSYVPTQAGTYYVKATVEGTDNYPGAVSEPLEFEISPKEIGLTWGETAFTYTGEAQKPTATATNLVGEDECEVTVNGAQKDSNAKTETEYYTATASITNPNYKLPQDPTTTFTIAQKQVTVSGITASNKVYDGKDTATVDTSEATLTGKVETDELTVSTTGAFSDKNVGTGKTVTFTDLILGGADAGNYTVKDDSQTSTKANITAKPVIVTADEITKYYGQDDPELTYTVEPKLIEGDEFTGNLIREEGEDVGDYDIEEGTLSAGNNYDIDYTPNTFEILQASNSVTASIEGWTYGDKANEPSAEADFGVETVVFTYSDKEDGDYTEEVPTQAGTYYLKASIAETNNYEGATSDPVEFEIAKKEIELEWSDTELTYNGQNQKPTATAKGLVGEDECVVTVEGEEIDSNVKTETNSYTAEATELSNPNYKLPSEVTKEYTIAPKELTSNMLSVDPESIKNDGTKKGPNITLNDKEVGAPLTDKDYDLSGETESDKSGTHVFEVKGKGNYTGTLSSSWVMFENRQNHDKQEGTDGKGDIEIFVDVIGNTENITVDNFTIDFAKKLLSEEDLERYNNGENVLIYVELEEESKDDVVTKDKELILSEFNRVAAKDIRWFDITVWKRIGNDKATQIHDTANNLEMTISVPDEYKNAPADNTRTFYLARSHNGEAEIITKTNEKKVGLSSNKFSIYALAYRDTYNGGGYFIPKTGD